MALQYLALGLHLKRLERSLEGDLRQVAMLKMDHSARSQLIRTTRK